MTADRDTTQFCRMLELSVTSFRHNQSPAVPFEHPYYFPNLHVVTITENDSYLMMHSRHDIAAQIVGAAELGEPYDTNRNH